MFDEDRIIIYKESAQLMTDYKQNLTTSSPKKVMNAKKTAKFNAA
jgi:hypothetical protein